MDNNEQRYGTLLTPDIRIHRQYFREMVKMLGVRVIYRAPKPNKHYTTYGEIESNYEPPILVGCIFENHPDQKTMKKLGWVSELTPEELVISVDYDLPNLQKGALFIIPSGIDEGKGRLFRVTELTTKMIYPASVTCRLAPEYEDTYIPESQDDFTMSDFNLLATEDDRLFSE